MQAYGKAVRGQPRPLRGVGAAGGVRLGPSGQGGCIFRPPSTPAPSLSLSRYFSQQASGSDLTPLYRRAHRTEPRPHGLSHAGSWPARLSQTGTLFVCASVWGEGSGEGRRGLLWPRGLRTSERVERGRWQLGAWPRRLPGRVTPKGLAWSQGRRAPAPQDKSDGLTWLVGQRIRTQ